MICQRLPHVLKVSMMGKLPRKARWRARTSLEQEEMMGSSSTSATTRLRRKALASSEVVAVMLIAVATVIRGIGGGGVDICL